MATSVLPPYGGSVLQNGSSGPDVALVQRWLNGLRGKWPVLRPVSVDGRYGSGTAAAVKLFQALTGLKEDGRVGSATWNKLYDEYAALHGAGEIYPGISQRTGHRGAAVKSSQEHLQQLIPALDADGKFGAKTKQAVEAHQTLQNLKADGIIGPKTWASLFGRSAD